MIKILFFLTFFLFGTCLVRAVEATDSEGTFLKQLDTIKNPFEDGLPKPVFIPRKPVIHPKVHRKIIKLRPKPKPFKAPVIILPKLDLKGIIVGEEMHEAIINDKVISLQGTIEGARLVLITKDGVTLIYKGKKFFLKVD